MTRSCRRGGKFEPRNKRPDSLDISLRCAKQHIGIWCMIYGNEHREERIQATHTLERLHGARTDLFTISALANAWGSPDISPW